jgi:hypothetical protein
MIEGMGGAPEEAASVEAIVVYCDEHGFESVVITRDNGRACNEFALRKSRAGSAALAPSFR